MVLNTACRQLAREMLLALNIRHSRPTCVLQPGVRDVITQLKLHRRGCRAGNHRRNCLSAEPGITSSVVDSALTGVIPTIIGNRRANNNNNNQLSPGRRCERSCVIRRIHLRGPHNNIQFGLFNACSISNKSASVQQWIVEKINMLALVETWHEDASSPDLIVCAPPGVQIH